MDLARSVEVARRWEAEGKAVAAATLVRVQGPAPRPLGSRFLVSSAGDMEGSVSGGCVENDVFLHAEQVLESGRSKLVGYGISDEAAFEVGLSCGGVIDVYIERFRIDQVGQYVASQRSGALASVVDGPGAGTRGVFDHELGLIAADLSAEVVEAILPSVRLVMDTEHPTITSVAGSEVFVEPVAPPPRLVIFGAVEIGQTLSALAARAGFSVTVCDPRSAFTTPDRFPDAREVITAWPEEVVDRLALDERTFVVVLSHDPRYEDPVVQAALAREVRYLGAMGSRKTHAKRLERLAGAGVPPSALARIHGPIGLDLGANGARETAVEILAEMVLVRHATGTGRSASLPSAD